MSNYYNRQWRLPNAWNGTESNVNKQSNYSMYIDKTPYIKSSLSVDELNEITISLWFKTSISNQSDGVLISFPESSTGTGLDISFQYSSPNEKIRFNTYTHSSNNRVEANFNYSDNNWHHLICSYNGSVHNIYIDGVLKASESASGTLKNAQNEFFIGAFNTTYPSLRADNTFFDQVCVFNYPLSDGGVSVGQTATGQIATLYGGGSAMANPMTLSPKPVAYYPLGDQDSFNGSNYLVPNSSLKDYVFGFNGINDYIDLGNLSVFEPTSNYTFSIWFNSGSYVYKTLFGDTSNAFAQGIIALLRSSSALDYYHNTTTTYKTLTLSLTDFPINTWHNLTITWSASTGILRGFIDGKFNAQLTGVNDVDWGNISLELGRYYNTFYYDSKLSNFVMWDATLTDGFSGTPTAGDIAGGQVAEVYNNGTPQTTITGTPVGWWKLDASATFDGSNWSIPDSSSNSNNGTMYGSVATLPAALQQSDLSFTSGYSPYALSFDGTDDIVEIANTTDFAFGTGGFTISLWVNFVSLTSGGYNILDFRTSGSGTTVGSLWINSSNGLRWYVSGSYLSASIPAASFSNNTWYNIIILNNGSTTSFYLNGASIDSASDTTSYTAAPLTIGGYSNGGYVVNGSLSNISIWNTNLSASQVTEIYNEGKPSNLNNHSAYSNLVSWWQLGSNSSFNSSLNQWTCIDEKGTNTGESSQTFAEDAIVDGVGSYANGLGTSGLEIVGSAPFSDANSLSVNMDVLDRVEDTPS